MSIELQNPTTLLGKVDAAAAHVAHIRLAAAIGDREQVLRSAIEAERLLFSAQCDIEDAEEGKTKWWAVVADSDGKPKVCPGRYHNIAAVEFAVAVLNAKFENRNFRPVEVGADESDKDVEKRLTP